MSDAVWAGEVEQIADGDERVTLHKEVHQLRGDMPLSLIRKHLPGGPTLPPVLLVHGFAQNRYSWHTSKRSMSAWLAARGWDVWNLELRGHGRSRSAGLEGAARFSEYVEDVLRAASRLPGPAFWVGHSLGGAALYAAATMAEAMGVEPLAFNPDELGTTPSVRVRGIVGIGALYLFGQANPLVGTMARLSWAARDTVLMKRLQVRTKLAGHVIARLYGLADATGYAIPLSGWWPGSIEPELLEERILNGFDWTSINIWMEMSRWATTGRFDYDEAWSHTDVPLLVLLGDKDHLLPPADGRVAWERSGSHDKQVRIFDDWHDEVHWGHLDLILGRYAPRHVWPALESWMRERAEGPAF